MVKWRVALVIRLRTERGSSVEVTITSYPLTYLSTVRERGKAPAYCTDIGFWH